MEIAMDLYIKVSKYKKVKVQRFSCPGSGISPSRVQPGFFSLPGGTRAMNEFILRLHA